MKSSFVFGEKKDYYYNVPDDALTVSLDIQDKSSDTLNGMDIFHFLIWLFQVREETRQKIVQVSWQLFNIWELVMVKQHYSGIKVTRNVKWMHGLTAPLVESIILNGKCIVLCWSDNFVLMQKSASCSWCTTLINNEFQKFLTGNFIWIIFEQPSECGVQCLRIPSQNLFEQKQKTWKD